MQSTVKNVLSVECAHLPGDFATNAAHLCQRHCAAFIIKHVPCGCAAIIELSSSDRPAIVNVHASL